MQNAKKETIHYNLSSIFSVIAGNALYALAVKLFLLPSKLITGGTTGIALVVNKLTELPISGFVLCFNMLMLLLGFIILGKQFALTTLASTFLYPMFLTLFDKILGNYYLTSDIFLCTVFTGLGIGFSLGLVIRSGASTGGMDIPPLILQKLFRIPVSISMYVFDICILLAQAVFQPTDRLLYGIVLVLIYTVVLDKIMLMGNTRTEVKVISEHADEIREAILKDVDRGVTMLNGEGGYERKEIQMVMSIVSNRELSRVERLIHRIDPECFMVISRVNEVSGHGFSLKKQYR